MRQKTELYCQIPMCCLQQAAVKKNLYSLEGQDKQVKRVETQDKSDDETVYTLQLIGE